MAEPIRRIGIAALEERTGWERTTIYRRYKAGQFPAPHYLGRDRLWFLSEIEAWEADRMARPAPKPVVATPRARAEVQP